MLEITDFLAKTIILNHPTDPFNDALEDLRISGNVLLHEAYAPPWAIDVPSEEKLREVLGVERDVRVLPFHLVRRGSFNLSLKGQSKISVCTPEVLLCPSGAPHTMSSGYGARAVAFEAILTGSGPTPATSKDNNVTEMVCGVFMAHSTPLNPLLGALPPALKVSTSGTQVSSMLARVVDMLALELDQGALNSFTTSRLLEVFCAEAIRAYQKMEGTTAVGWFRGLAEPRISAVMQCIHTNPGEAWSVQTLAQVIALSPSHFAALFRETTGEAVMAYVGRWRANVACRLLRNTDLSVSSIANAVGYESAPAFTRAFKSLLGVSPAQWRGQVKIENT
jgi:AraC-like DNA-binding protein